MFFEKFDRLSDMPDAAAKMRELVLGLAMQGKLAQQNEDDESAEELLGQIYAEKLSLAKQGVIKHPSARRCDFQSDCDSLPFQWVHAPLEALCISVTDGDHLPPPKTETGVPFLVIGDVRWGGIDFTDCRRVSEEYYEKLDWIRKPQKRDILYTLVGSFGIPVVVRDSKPFCVQRHIGILRPSRHIEVNFLAYALASNLAFKQAELAATGIAQKTVPLAGLRKIIIPLPPLAEQKRIVAKVDELMALCDRLEAQQRERETRQAALARASLARFAQAPTPGNLHYLFHPSYAVTTADLRKAILTLAVQGKLVPQNPNDDAVENSVSAARKGADLPVSDLKELAPEELPFTVPGSWRWVTVSDVADTRLGKMLDKEKNRGESHPYLRNTNVHWFRFELESIKTMLFEDSEIDEYRLERGDLLICEGGHGIARSAVWDGRIPNIMFQKALHRVRPLSCLNGHFLAFCLWVYERDGVLQRYYTGAGIPHFTGKALAQVAFPLPPIAEQRRIVAKVDQLMALADELETQLTTSCATGERLLNAIVAELTGASRERRAPARLVVMDGAQAGDVEDVVPAAPGARTAQPSRAGVRRSEGASPSPDETDAATRLAALLREKGNLSNSEAQAATGLDPATVRSHLQALVAAGRARTEGQRRGMRYIAVD